MNLYQYIPPNSAHPPGMIKGMIYGMLRQYYLQNSIIEDYWTIAMLFYNRLKDRGWPRATLEPIFVAAHEKIRSQFRSSKRLDPKPEQNSAEPQIILHLEYHPDDIPRKRVRELYERHCGELLRRILRVKRAIVAYSRPLNLRDLLQSAKLHQTKGKEVSTFFGG